MVLQALQELFLRTESKVILEYFWVYVFPQEKNNTVLI